MSSRCDGAGRLICGFTVRRGVGKRKFPPCGECACAQVSASGNIALYEQQQYAAVRAGQEPRRPPVKGPPGEALGPGCARPCGALRARRGCRRGLPVRPYGGDPGLLPEAEGSGARDGVAQKSGRPLCRRKRRGHPDESCSCRTPSSSATRLMAVRSSQEHISRPCPGHARISFRCALPGSARLPRPRPDVPSFPPHRASATPARPLACAQPKAPRPVLSGHGLGRNR